jgi:hypothetical protein
MACGIDSKLTKNFTRDDGGGLATRIDAARAHAAAGGADLCDRAHRRAAMTVDHHAKAALRSDGVEMGSPSYQPHIVCVVQTCEAGEVPTKQFFVAMAEGLHSAVEAVRRVVAEGDAVVPTGAILSPATAARLDLKAESVWPL